jgi:phage I-like protein
MRDDGLWAVDVTWTERAAELLRNGEYRYFSPVIFWTDEDHTDVAALGPVALTNDPAMRGVPALAARRADPHSASEPEAPASIPAEPRASATGPLSTDAPNTQRAIIAGCLAAPDADNATDLETRLTAAEEQLTLLRRQLSDQDQALRAQRAALAEQAAEMFIERGLRLGKIVDSTRADWRADYLRDTQRTGARLARSPVLLPPGRVMPLDRRGNVATRSRSQDAAAGSAPTAAEPEDFSAYEQAAAAGRVRWAGS